MSCIPGILCDVIPTASRFAKAYGGSTAPYSRPALVTRVYYGKWGEVIGFKYAPLTSSLDLNKVST